MKSKLGWLMLAVLMLLASAVGVSLLSDGQQEDRQQARELGVQPELAGGPEENVRGFGQRDIVDLASVYPEIFFRNLKTEEKRLALTFDDGPDAQYTEEILDVLKKHDVKATFFLVGDHCLRYPEVVERIVVDGHIIGNHSMTHPNIIKISEDEVKAELQLADDTIEKFAGYRPLLFRSPYGSLTPELVEMIGAEGYKIISWNVDSLDWKGLPAEEVKLNIIENVEKGAIILQHSLAGEGKDLSGTVTALDEILTILEREDYHFVTVPELLALPYQREEATSGRVYLEIGVNTP